MITYGTRVWCPYTGGNVGIALGSLAAMDIPVNDLSRRQVFVDFGAGFSGHSCGNYIDTKTGWIVLREDLEELPERFTP